MVVVLDGPMGTELHQRGIPTPLPGWSAHALETQPDVVTEIHRAYASAGATVHTTNTFRTRSNTFPTTWADLARRAVQCCRDAIPATHRIAGSIAPIEDCYRPDLSPSPAVANVAHRALADVLAEAGCDLLLCETFPNPDEAIAAVDAACATGLETWLALTPGPQADLLSPEQVRMCADRAIDVGARVILVNCLPVLEVDRFLAALAGLGVPFGAYPNSGAVDDVHGWETHPFAPEPFADAALGWVKAGATIVGSCCGTGPDHTRALTRRLAEHGESTS